jgi:TonB family protein
MADYDSFEKKEDWGSWAYEHRAGILATVAVYLLLGVFIVTARIVVRPTEVPAAFEIDLQNVRELIEERDRLEEEVRRMQEADPADYESVLNRVSDEQGELDAGLRDAQNASVDRIYDEARAVQERVQASRNRYEQGVREADNILNNRPAANSGENSDARSAKFEGKVSISYSLDGRRAVDLYRPTYLCRGGGDVVVRIAVDRNGRVVDASVDAVSVDDDCLKESAVMAARNSRFSADGAAPARQTGTITYRFASQ